MDKLKPYQKELDYSYTIGVFPTLELLAHRPEQVRRVLLHSRGETNSGVARIRERCAAHRIPVDVADTQIVKLSHSENSYALGVFSKYETALQPHENHVVLLQPNDSGNLGTIVRTMLGFDLTNLAVIRPAVDLFDPKTIRASMGALFQLQFAYLDTFAAYRQQFGQRLYPLMTDGRCALAEADFQPPWALLFGSEGEGLGAEFHELGTSLRIPQSGRVDSLNLAVAVGIALYAATLRQ